MLDYFGNEIIEFHPRYKPLPPGYKIVQLDSGQRCAFAHYAASLTPTPKSSKNEP
jgi:hypothetical protein